MMKKQLFPSSFAQVPKPLVMMVKFLVMRKSWLAAMLVIVMLSGCSNKLPNPDYLSGITNSGKPDFHKLEYEQSGEFHFILGFGYNARNILNTFDGTFTKDLVKGFSTIRFQLSDEQVNLIEEKFRELDILSYPEEFKPDPVNPKDNTITIVMPCSSYYIRVELDEQMKEVFWKDENKAYDPKAIALEELIHEIEEMVYERDEYIKMPKEKGGYE
ncbi:MAG: hypothetical protein GX115_14240 [Ruminiclostridium sp.]|nr:hypothetical protein [Ruminiclostridium sp.]